MKRNYIKPAISEELPIISNVICASETIGIGGTETNGDNSEAKQMMPTSFDEKSDEFPWNK